MNYGCELVHFNLCEVNFNQAFVKCECALPLSIKVISLKIRLFHN